MEEKAGNWRECGSRTYNISYLWIIRTYCITEHGNTKKKSKMKKIIGIVIVVTQLKGQVLGNLIPH